MKRTGNTARIRSMTPLQRFHENYEVQPDGCWVWKLGRDTHGYGCFHVRKRYLAHRWAYENLVGPVPEGLELDHLCRNRACVNPDHLEPVTRQVNQLRGETLPAANIQKTHCPQGHPYEGDNLVLYDKGWRRCRECNRLRAQRDRALGKTKAQWAARQEKKRAAKAA